MKFKIFKSVSSLSFLIFGIYFSIPASHAAREPLGPFLESVIGVTAVLVRGASGEVRTVRSGSLLFTGDSFLSGPKGFLRIAYETGIQVLIAPESYIGIEEQNDGIESSGVPLLKLNRGEVRILVEKGETEVKGNTKKHRFYVRTPSAFLAVRGTDFTVSGGNKETQVFTFTGIIDLARGLDPGALDAGASDPLVSGQSVTFKNGVPDKPVSFRMAEYLKAFWEKYPPMERLWGEASRDVRSKRLEEKFRKARIERETPQK